MLALSPSWVLFYGLSVAFVVVYMLPRKIKLQTKNPLSCMQCMTGWSSLGIGLISGYRWESIFLMFAGLFVGGLFEVIKMRYL